jgi:hypothetical protein
MAEKQKRLTKRMRTCFEAPRQTSLMRDKQHQRVVRLHKAVQGSAHRAGSRGRELNL